MERHLLQKMDYSVTSTFRVNLFDHNFSHVKSEIGFDASCFTRPEHGEWVRNQLVWGGDTVFTDEYCFSSEVDQIVSTRKVAWLMESPGVKPRVYQNFHLVCDKFNKVFTFLTLESAKSIGVQEDKYVNCPLGGAWVEPVGTDNKKSKLCSLIASGKNDLPGHRLRHHIAQSSKNIDLYGRAYKSVNNKSEALNDYAFSVCIENVSMSGYFTEKLIDCFLTKTIPVYYGDPNIDNIFDKRGILDVQDIDNLNFEKYESMIDSVNRNFDTALKFKSTDDNVFLKLRSLA
jgi:hypothetical protein